MSDTPLGDALRSGLSGVNPGQQLKRESNRRSQRYAVQFKDGPVVVDVQIVHISIAGGLSPARIKEQLQRKCMNFLNNKYPDKPLSVLVAGRIDGEIL